VGVGGLSLGGGIGWKVRNRGLALDNLLAAEVVTASGEVVRASADEHPDLFWALRGGGGNFGVVTAFEFRAHPSTDVHFGKISFPASQAADVLPGWVKYLQVAPEELSSNLYAANPFLGGPQAPVDVYVAYDGDAEEAAAAALAPIRSLGTAIADEVTRRPYGDILEAATPPPGLRFLIRSGFAEPQSAPEVARILAEVGASERSPILGLRSVGGAVSRVAPDATAYPHRSASVLVTTAVVGPPPAVDAARPAVSGVWESLAPHVTGAYANFLSDADPEDVAAAYPAATYRRLAEVKRRYDPTNVFAGNHNIRPS
jgi:FAD/FMN-containing dehydrogenase